MTLECYHQLEPEQLDDLQNLLSVCQKTDKGTPNIYPHILEAYRFLPVTALNYEKGQLTAFISVYFFYEDACEVSLLVSPVFRRKGLAKQLFKQILPSLEAHGMKKIIFSRSHYSENEWLIKKGFSYETTEYRMRRSSETPENDSGQSLLFHKATYRDVPFLEDIDNVCFASSDTAATNYEDILEDERYQIFIAYKGERPIGKAHIRCRHEGAILSDIGIIPECQGQGFGSALLSYCINYSLQKGRSLIELDVESDNQSALKLYQRRGFKEINACDYWVVSMEKLLKQINP